MAILPYANSLDPDKTRYNFLYILGVNRLWGEKTSGGKLTRGERPGGKRFWGEATRGGEWFGAKRPGFCYNKMPVFLLGSTVDKDELELNNEQEFSIAHKPVILSQYVIV